MLDHVTLRVKDLEKAREFYAKALAPLGYELLMEFPGAAGLGVKGKPYLWLVKGKKNAISHVAFVAKDRNAVRRFHAAGLRAGGKDNGKPGVRKDYHPRYYAAFLLDPDGHNIEAVIHR